MLEGLVWGLLFYSIALLLALFCYRIYSPLYRSTCWIIFLCWVGHYIGAFSYIFMETDSFSQFFGLATPEFTGLGTGFVKNMAWYVREYITGDSYLATVYFFSAFAFLGSVLWFLLFLQMGQWLKISNQRYILPSIILMCWPSVLFFTAGIGKDSLCYFLIPLIFLSWNQFFYERNNKLKMLIVFLSSMLIITMIRPYLLMIFAVSYYLSIFKGITKFTYQRLLLMIIFIPFIIIIVGWVLATQISIDVIDMEAILNRSLSQQEAQNIGTSFPIISHDPRIELLFLPYSFTMNLIMPLFIFSRNLLGLFSSFENVLLLLLIYQFIKKRKTFKLLKSQLDPVKFCFYFFIIGMIFMSLVNTNLGLAMRQKSMYVPAFFVVAMLVWLYDKQNYKKTNYRALAR